MMNGKTDRPIFMTEALLDRGTEEVADSIVKHKQELISCGELNERRRVRAKYELMTAIDASVRSVIEAGMNKEMQKLADDVVTRKLDPHSAAERILERLVNHLQNLVP